MEENKTSIPLVFITTYTPHIRKEELRAKIVKHWHKIENHRELSKLTRVVNWYPVQLRIWLNRLL